MKREPTFWMRVTIEALLIVFSVLLALFLNGRWQTGREDEASRLQLDMIQSELQENRRIVSEWLERHGEIVKRLASLRAAGAKREPLIVDHQLRLDRVFGQSVIDTIIRSTSWETAKTTGLVRTFEPELVNLLSDVYSLQQQGPMQSLDRIGNLLFDRASHDEAQIEQTLVLLEASFKELIGQENFLLEAYEKVLARLDATRK